MILEVTSEDNMKTFGARLGRLCTGGEIIELVGDVGAGKTTLTKGIAAGMQIDEDVQSPSFTISRVYISPVGVRLAHYDFYRLSDAGIMADELAETVHDPHTVTVIEWAGVVSGVLPADHVRVELTAPDETIRRVTLTAGGARSAQLLEQLT